VAPRCRSWWWAILALGLVLAVRNGTLGLLVDPRPGEFGHDFAQEYLLARAALDGFDPYQAMGELSVRYGISGWEAATNPNPHAPPAGLLFLPLGLLQWTTAAVVWLRLQAVLLVYAAWLLLRTVHWPVTVLSVPALTLLLLGLEPLKQDLDTGNVTILLLAFLAGAQLALTRGRSGLGGALIGLAILVKPVPWPLLVVLAVRREGRAFLSACGAIAVGYLVAVAVYRPERLLDYATHVLPGNNTLFATSLWNVSLWTLGARLFDGVSGAPGVAGLTALPLLPGVPGARIVGALVAGGALLAAWVWSRRAADLSQALTVLLCVMVLASPVTWDFYFTLAVLPAVYYVAHARRHMRIAVLPILGLLLLIPLSAWWRVGQVLAGHSWSQSDTWAQLPFGLGLLVLIPSVLLALLGVLATRPRRWFG
jgi:hypothetical protein